jgi:hypothetical protein
MSIIFSYMMAKTKKDTSMGQNFYFKSSIETTYCENSFIPWHQFLWFLQNAVILGFSNSWFQTLQATVTGKIVFRWILYSWFK